MQHRHSHSATYLGRLVEHGAKLQPPKPMLILIIIEVSLSGHFFVGRRVLCETRLSVPRPSMPFTKEVCCGCANIWGSMSAHNANMAPQSLNILGYLELFSSSAKLAEGNTPSAYAVKHDPRNPTISPFHPQLPNGNAQASIRSNIVVPDSFGIGYLK